MISKLLCVSGDFLLSCYWIFPLPSESISVLSDEIKQKVEAKFNELGDMCERGELEPEQAYELFKEFEDRIILECAKIMEAEQPPEEDEVERRIR